MTAKEIAAQVKNLPMVSQAALKLVCLLDQPAVGNDDIVNVLRYDNVLTAKLLRTCNSSYFGFEESISSVEQAVLILGHQQILQTVLGLAFGGAMSTAVPACANQTKALWNHSLVTAVAAEQLAKSDIPLETEPAIAFTAGLLHDIGKLAFYYTLNAEVQSKIQSRIGFDGLPHLEAEREITGTDHSEVGGQLLAAWHLPASIVEAATYHHHPAYLPQPQLSVLIHVANSLGHRLEAAAAGGYSAGPETRATQILGLTSEKYETLAAASEEASRGVKKFMELS